MTVDAFCKTDEDRCVIGTLVPISLSIVFDFSRPKARPRPKVNKRYSLVVKLVFQTFFPLRSK